MSQSKHSAIVRIWVAALVIGPACSALHAEVPATLRVPLHGSEVADALFGSVAPAEMRLWALQGTALDPSAGEASVAPAGAKRALGSASAYTTIQGSVFIPNHDAFIVGDAPPWGLFCEAGGNRFASAQAELPDGASLVALRAWTRDDVLGSALAVSAWEVCQSESDPGTTDVTFLGSVVSTEGSSSSELVLSSPVTVDVAACFYPVLVEFGVTPPHCGPDLVLFKVRLFWDRPAD